MGGGLSAHDAADRLNTGMRTKKCRLWCDGNELPVAYLVTSLLVVARPEADGRWRADVVSSTLKAWEKPAASYVFEFEVDEVTALRRKPKPPNSEKAKPSEAKPPELRKGEAARSEAASAKAADREQVMRTGSV